MSKEELDGLPPGDYELQPQNSVIWQAKREWESIVDCLDVMVLLVDQSGLIRRCNQAFACFLVRPYEEVNGRLWPELFAECGLVEEIRNGNRAEYYHGPSGRTFCCCFYPFAAEYADVKGLVLALRDVSERHRVATELQRKNSELAAAYDDLKASQAKLLQQEKLASIGQLAAGVAHEINNPVGFVTSNLGSMVKYLDKISRFLREEQRLLAAAADRELQEKIEVQRQALKLDFVLADAADLLRESLEGVGRVKNIVQNLKRFSRVDQALYQRVDLNQCLEDTLNIVWNELKYKVTLTKEYGELPLTWCYPQQLNQVFMNLLLNAVQAIEKEGEIGIRTWAEGGAILVSISDTGCGIPFEHQKRLFDPFFTTKEAGKGTGLGLSIVYDIVVQQHGGEVMVCSEPGRGSVFRIWLPVREQE
ncbi:sensor histidine kinase [Desulfurivibrio alkaliphilus]|uniref:histidine kinase n=1 Tax=Desulfurivibrio alkaliphilus (strain DSM 19089 / UNIQEM U267 / AHT2) TaxID=589865 RepID=D6Z6N7_DESAT|nr:ATP-binding protein [Desulfurivibrio alkaliphilus]ADH84996.1 PAS/PAC sensor signal transduction histidine kinase [Desulfurivibrio alkaliphilus AHT 2]